MSTHTEGSLSRSRRLRWVAPNHRPRTLARPSMANEPRSSSPMPPHPTPTADPIASLSSSNPLKTDSHVGSGTNHQLLPTCKTSLAHANSADENQHGPVAQLD